METINPNLYGPRGTAYLNQVTSNATNHLLETAHNAEEIKQALGGHATDSYHASTHDTHSQQQMAWRAMRHRSC